MYTPPITSSIRACTSGSSNSSIWAAPSSRMARAVRSSPLETDGSETSKMFCKKEATCSDFSASRRARSRSSARRAV